MNEVEVLDRLEKELSKNYESWGYERMQPTKAFILERSKQWSSVIKIPYYEIIDKWLDMCNYSMINYFQDCNQPKLDEKVKIFETKEDYKKSLQDKGFRCPYCGGVSHNPVECDSGVLVKLSNYKEKRPCNWVAYGLLGTMGKGTFVFIKENFMYGEIFTPIAWEKTV